jgi:hypothetical protein
MEGAGTLDDDSGLEPPRSRRRSRTGRHRSRGLNEKLRRRDQATLVRKILTVLVLGSVVVLASLYVARNSTGYEPLPTPGSASE